MSKEQFSIDFMREYDTYNVPLLHGESVTLVSEPTWDLFADSLSMLEDPGTYILTPELITAADRPQPASVEPAVLAERVRDVQEISLDCPKSTILLGTEMAYEYAQSSRNSIVFIKNGAITGQARADAARLVPTIRPLIYSDLPYRNVYQPLHSEADTTLEDIGHTAHTLLIGACWSAPPHIEPLGISGATPEQEMHRICGLLFGRYAQLDTIAMCDRLPAAAFTEQPLNFVARRTNS